MTKRTLLDSLRARGIVLPSEVESDLPDADGIPFGDQAGDDDDARIRAIAEKTLKLIGEK